MTAEPDWEGWPKRCDQCGAVEAILAPHTGKLLCDDCFVELLSRDRPDDILDPDYD